MQSSTVQNKISHIHFSGGTPTGNTPIEDLTFSNLQESERLKNLLLISIKKFSGIHYAKSMRKRIIRRFSALTNSIF